jgi:CheY-like chemotaxis protein/DNA-binding XRE family transcriptional regulator
MFKLCWGYNVLTIEEAFGAVIRRLRRENNLSQEKLASESGIDRSFLSNIEGGKQQPGLVTIFSIANALNIIPSKIIKEVELLLRCCHPDMFKSESSKWSFDWVSKIEQVTDTKTDCFKGTETILVADEEELIREMLSSFLTDYGYNVILAHDGSEAFHKYSEGIEDIKLVILDVVMPNKNGNEVYEEIKSLNPKINIILTSGYRAHEVKTLDGKLVIFKPFSPIDMLTVVRATLDSAL